MWKPRGAGLASAEEFTGAADLQIGFGDLECRWMYGP